MANYEGMTQGQTVFLRKMRRLDFTHAGAEPPHSWMPTRETMRRWMESPVFRDAYTKARQVMWDEAEATLLLAGAAAAARLAEFGRLAGQPNREKKKSNGQENSDETESQELTELRRRTLLDLVRVAKTVAKSGFEAEEQIEEQYPRRRTEIHPDGCDHPSHVSCDKAETMLASMAIQRSCWKLGVELPPEVVTQLENAVKNGGRQGPLARGLRPPTPGATGGQEEVLVENGKGG